MREKLPNPKTKPSTKTKPVTVRPWLVDVPLDHLK